MNRLSSPNPLSLFRSLAVSLPGSNCGSARSIQASAVAKRRGMPLRLLAVPALLAVVCAASVTAANGQAAQFTGTQKLIVGSVATQPVAAAVDGSGNVYFTDTANNQVLKETLSAGSYTQSVVANSASNGLSRPWGVAVDSTGRVYIADIENNRILKETPGAGTYTQSIVASGLSAPVGVAVDKSGNVYVANTGANNVLKETLSAGAYTQSIVAGPTQGLLGPGSVAVDASGDVYIADINNSLVVKEAPSSGGYTQTTVATAAANGLDEPYGIAVDGSGDVYLADYLNERIVKETPTSTGYTQTTVVGDLVEPSGVAADSAGDIYVTGDADYAGLPDFSVLELSTAGGNSGSANVGSSSTTTITAVVTAATPGTLGSVALVTQGATSQDFTDVGTGTCGPGTYVAGDSCTVDVTFSPKFPGERTGAVEVLDPTGKVLAYVLITGTGISPQAAFRYEYGTTAPPVAIASAGIPYGGYLAKDGAGDLYVANNESAEHADVANGSVVEFPVSGTGFGAPIFVANDLPFPQGVAVDGAGNVYALFDADLSYDPNTGSVVKYAKTTTGFAPAVTLASGLSYPNGLAIDGAGNLFFASYSNGLTNGVNTPNTGKVLELPFNGSSYGAPVSLASGLNDPANVALDTNGDIFVTIPADSSNGVNSGAVLEIKKTGGSYAAPATVVSGLNYAGGIRVDPSGNLLVITYPDTANSNLGTVSEFPVAAAGYGAPIALAAGLNSITDLQTRNGGNIFVLAYNTDVYVIQRSSPPSFAFASTQVGATSSDSPRTVALENIGNTPLTFPVPSAGDNPSISANFTLSDSSPSDCPLLTSSSLTAGSLAAGAACLLSVSFKPLATGALGGTLAVTDDSLNAAAPGYAVQEIPLTGTGTAATGPVVSFSATSVSFGSQEIGTTSASQTVTMTNIGSATLNITKIAVTGTNASAFVFSNSCGTSLAAGVSCTIHGHFSPTAAGAMTAAITITDNATGSPQTISLTGTGGTAIMLSPSGLSFGTEGVGVTSASQTVTMTNTGPVALSISSIKVTGADATSFIFSNSCGTSLAVGANCTIHGHFTPEAAGELTAAISITDNATGSPQSINLSGTGIGLDSTTITLSATNLSLGIQEIGTISPSQDVTLTNTGTVALAITSFTVTGADASSFNFAISCGTTLAPGANCLIHGHFKPTVAGALTAAITMNDTAVGSPHTIALSGSGAALNSTTLSLSATSLTFASQAVGTTSATQTVTLTNTGTAAMAITSVTVTGTNASSFAFSSGCGSGIAAGASCTIHGHFTPATTGTLTAAVSITDSATGSPQKITLTGTGH